MSEPSGSDGVLVLDSDGQSGLGVVRSLGRKGISVTAGGPSRRSLGMLSRFSDDAFVHPDPAGATDAFLECLLEHLEATDYEAVFPVVDDTTLVLATNDEAVEATGTVLATEDRATFERTYDKAALFEVLADLDVPAPATHAPTSMDEVRDLAPDVEYPAVVKPRSKTHVTDGGCETTIVSDENYVETPEELVETFRRLLEAHEGFERRYPIVQAYVPGTTTTTVGLAADGDLVQYFQEERLRTYPSSGGNSALLGAVREPKMVEYAEEVLGALEWTGPAMVEFMRTPEGEFQVIEVNGRYWGSLPFAIECGVDVPWLHYLQLRGVDPRPLVDRGEYRTDVVQRRLFYEDCKWLGERLSRGDLGALGQFVGDVGRARHTFVSLDDPLPTAGAVLEAGELGLRAAGNRLRAR